MIKYHKAANTKILAAQFMDTQCLSLSSLSLDFYPHLLPPVYFLNNIFFVIKLFGLCVTKLDRSSIEHN